MYETYFGLTEAPFSIAPDPRYLYLSQRHQEALAHLLYGVNSGGGFVLLTGEVGAGKTTVCRCLLEQIPATCDVAYIFNPQLTVGELLQTICNEFGIHVPPDTKRAKVYIDAINTYLLDAHAKGRQAVLIIDEAQNLSIAVLEQMRLLTNLETNQRKLLQIMLLGQPELATLLARPELRQLKQRVVARYHLMPLEKREVSAYVRHRLDIAGTQHMLFPQRVMDRLYRLSGGVPRVINVLCDRALLGTYVQGRDRVNNATLSKAAREVFGTEPKQRREWFYVAATAAMLTALVAALGIAAWYYRTNPTEPTTAGAASSATPATTTAAGAAAPATTTDSPSADAVESLPATLDWPADIPLANSRALAYSALFKVWALDYRNGETCPQAARRAGTGMNCLTSRGGLSEVRYHNRPATLQLRDAQGREFPATLIALNDRSATFAVGDATTTVAIGALAEQWTGHYTLLWRMPPDMPRNLRKGAQGESAEWVRSRLAQALGVSVEPGSPAIYDDKLEQQIKQFQLAQGLVPDGAPGERTLIRLYSVTDASAPKLFGAEVSKAKDE